MFIYTVGCVLLIIAFRLILRRLSDYFHPGFYEERQARYHRVISPFDTISAILPMGIGCVIGFIHYSDNKWGDILGVGAGLFLGLAIGYMSAFVKD